jgi:hypothetical protein
MRIDRRIDRRIGWGGWRSIDQGCTGDLSLITGKGCGAELPSEILDRTAGLVEEDGMDPA